MSRNKSLIIGAGNIGKGPIMYFLRKNNHDIVVSSRNYEKLIDLTKKGYTIYVKEGVKTHDVYVKDFEILSLETLKITKMKPRFDNVFVCVYESAYDLIVEYLSPLILNAYLPLNIILCSNDLKCVDKFKEAFVAHNPETRIPKCVGIAHALISIGSRPAKNSSYDVEINLFNYDFDVDETGLRKDVGIKELQTASDLNMRYYRKLYFINSTFAYLALMGTLKGYKTLNQCIEDQQLVLDIKNYLFEIAEVFAIEENMQYEISLTFSKKIIAKVLMPTDELPDRIIKNTLKQLGRTNRFIGPYMLFKNQNRFSIVSNRLLVLPFIENDIIMNQEMATVALTNGIVSAIVNYTDLTPDEVDIEQVEVCYESLRLQAIM